MVNDSILFSNSYMQQEYIAVGMIHEGYTKLV